MTLRIGVHPQTLILTLLSRTEILHRHLAEVGEEPEFVTYADGTLTPDRFVAGAIDVAGTGSTPPLTIQAAGGPLAYLSTSEPRPRAAALVAPQGSAVRAAADLRGRRVGFAVGSWQSSFIALALDGAGLGWSDVEIVDTRPDESGIDRERLDAWVASEPELSSGTVQVVVPTTGVLSNRSVLYARREATERHEVVGRLIAAVDEAERWTAENPAEAAALLAPESASQRDRTEQGIRSRPWGLVPVGDTFVAEQQRSADLLLRAGQIAAPIRVADAAPSALRDVVGTALAAAAKA